MKTPQPKPKKEKQMVSKAVIDVVNDLFIEWEERESRKGIDYMYCPSCINEAHRRVLSLLNKRKGV